MKKWELCEYIGKNVNFWLFYMKYWYCKDNMKFIICYYDEDIDDKLVNECY